MWKAASLLACLILAAASFAYAQSSTPGSHGAHHQAAPAAGAHSAHDQPDGDNSPSSQAFREANARMHAAMDIKMTGDADLDFVRGMIAHHQGAVDMAKILLSYGKNKEMRRLAESIIADQEREIAQMQAWLSLLKKPGE